MRTLLMCAALCGMAVGTTLAQEESPRPDPRTTPEQADRVEQRSETDQQPQHDARQADQQKRTAEQSGDRPNDPNYRHHNGRWWYWQNNAWLMWDGRRWVSESERRSYSYTPRRSYSYLQDQDAGGNYVPTEVGMPRSDASGMRNSFVAPSTVEYQKVLPSFGIRSAGSKVLGNY